MGADWDHSTPTTYYWEIIRDGGDAIVDRYTDDTYTTILQTTGSQTPNTSGVGLQYIKFMTWASGSSGGEMENVIDNIKFYDGIASVEAVTFDAQIDDIVIFDEVISYFAVETLYDGGNHRAPSELQNPSYASHWELDGTGTDAQKLASGIVNAQPPANPNTSSESVLKNVDVGQPAPAGETTLDASYIAGTVRGESQGVDCLGSTYKFNSGDYLNSLPRSSGNDWCKTAVIEWDISSLSDTLDVTGLSFTYKIDFIRFCFFRTLSLGSLVLNQ